MRSWITAGLLLAAAALPAQEFPWGRVSLDGPWEVRASAVRGDLRMGGSSTVFPLVQALAEQFQNEGYQGQLSIDNIGTGAGFKRFGAGEIDFANASRPITPPERRQAEGRRQGRLVTINLAKDALVIVVNDQNKAVADLDDDQIRALFAEADTWAEADPSWPAWKINRYIPETSHGTFEFFQEHFWDDKGTALKTADRTQRFQDYNQLADALAKDRAGIGLLGYAYYQESDHLRAVAYRGVLPSKAAVDDKSYGLARPLQVYTLSGVLASQPQAAAWLSFLVGQSPRYAAKFGYFPLTDEERKAQRQALVAALKK